MSATVAVTHLRSPSDDSFIQRTLVPVDQSMAFPAGSQLQPEALYVVHLADATAADRAEPGVFGPSSLFDPCTLYDCDATAPMPLRPQPLSGRALFRSAYPSPGYKLGLALPRPSVGRHRIHFIIFYESEATDPEIGVVLETKRVGYSPDTDLLLTFWSDQARHWTNGALDLQLEFVNHGQVRIPPASQLPFGQPGTFHDHSALVELAKYNVDRQPGELIAVVHLVDGDRGGGTAWVEDGIAVVGIIDPAAQPGWARVLLHELGHLFGASDKYAGPTGCSFEFSDEIVGPELYGCNYGPDGSVGSASGAGVSKLTARELGWVTADGLPATQPPPSCLPAPGSDFVCDP